MATYRINGFVFNRANVAGIDSPIKNALISRMVAREREICTVETHTVLCIDGPFQGQTIELSEGSITATLSIKGWTGHYSGGRWNGTTGQPVNVMPDQTNLSEKQTDFKAGKGFTAFTDLLGELAEDFSGRIIETIESSSTRAMQCAMDDFGFSPNTLNEFTGTYALNKREVPLPLSLRAKGGKFAKKYGSVLSLDTGRGLAGNAYFMDDFGDLHAFKNTREVFDAPYLSIRRRLKYSIGRTSYTIKATAESVASLRQKVIKAKRCFADKFVSAVPTWAKRGHQPAIEIQDSEMAFFENRTASPRKVDAPDAVIDAHITALATQDVAQVVASAQAGAAIEQAQATACEAPASEVQELAIVCEGEASQPQGISMGSTSSGNNAPAATSSNSCASKVPPVHAALTQAAIETIADTQPIEAIPAPAPAESPAPAPSTLGNDGNDDCPHRCPSGLKQKAIGKSGQWEAELYKNGAGGFVLKFLSLSAGLSWTIYATGSERIRALQALAHEADTPTPATPAPAEIETSPIGIEPPTSKGVEGGAGSKSNLAPEPAFERAKPFNLDPRALLVEGVQAEQLIGLGVNYTGNMANASGQGAITSVEDTRGQQWGQLRIVCTLEDGRTINADPHYFTASLRPILQFNSKHHGAPYLAELSTAATLKRFSESSAAELAKNAYAKAMTSLPLEFPHLKPGAAAAVNIRAMLKHAFPCIKFSVRSRSDSIDVTWTDGPTDAQVCAITERFSAGHFDGSDDCYKYSRNAFTELFGSVKYPNTRRELSDGAILAIIAQEWPETENRPSLHDYQQGAHNLRDEFNRNRVHLAAKNWTAK